MSAADAPGTRTRETNPLVRRVDALLRDREAEAVPLLTEVVERPAQAPPAPADSEPAPLGAELERALLARLIPALDRHLARARATLETELRRAVREAVAAALATRGPKPPPES